MFFYTKCCILTTVATTVFFGVVCDKSAPYFPIEISRTGTGRVSHIVFPIGAVLSFVVALAERHHNWQLLPFFGLILLALVTDEQSHAIHMLGVVLMVFPIFVQSCQSPTRLFLFLLLMGLYLGRLLIKGITVYHQSDPVGFTLKLMLSGGFENQAQELAFKLGGLLQWVFLYGMLELYTLE